MIKTFIKKTIEKAINHFFKLIIKNIIKDKFIMPNESPHEVYEIFKNINKKKFFDKKIILPYTKIDLLNRINIYKPYEIVEISTLDKQSEKKIKLAAKSSDLILPLAILKHESEKTDETEKIILKFSDTIQSLEIKFKNRFHYLPISSEKPIDEITVKSDINSVVVGKPILKDKKILKNKPKLIVHIFLDALAQSAIEKFGYGIMPNTKKYFEKNGIFFTNTYAQSEWTLSSMAGIFTGKYTNEHFLYHPRKKDKIKHLTLADVLQKEGYLTYSCTNVPKLSPVNGFDKGFDRCIYAIDKDYNFILNEACEQLDAFSGNQYLFLGFFDTHESHRLQPISSQVSNELKDFQYKKLKGSSKDTSILYDVERINLLKNSITHFDKKLQRLYDEIDKYDKEALVVLHSDHGVNFMTNTSELLGKEREKVIFLYKNNKKHIKDNSIKEIRELPSMICNDLKIDNAIQYDHTGYAISESLYPNKDYEIAVRDEKYVLFFKIAWEDVKNRNILSYKPKTSFHYLDQEQSKVDFSYSDNKDYLLHMNIAKNCFIRICDRLIEKES